MFCDNCGCEIQPGTTVCPVCGNILNNEGEKTGTPNVPEIKPEIKPEVRPEVKNDINKKPEAPIFPAEPDNKTEDEDGTTVLSSQGGMMEEEDEGTTVLAAPSAIQPTKAPNSPSGMLPNGMSPMMSNGRQSMPPNGMPPMQPNGMPPMQPNGMPPAGSKEQNKKKDKKNKKNKKKKGTGKKVALIAIPVVIVAALGVGAAIYVPKYLNYDKANTALNNGEIDKAIELYNKCGSYKDSQTMINGGAYYTYAENLAASGDLISAAENYHKAAGLSYEGASEKELECYYNQAEKLYGEGNYTEAADYYKKASGYNDADVKVKECAYENANVLMASGDYAGAVEAFTLASDYEDSADKIKECYYNEALAKMEAGEYEEASEEFLKSEYSDYMIQANDCIYQLAAAYVNDGKYEEALDTYEKVDSEYKDCSKDIATCQEKWGDSLVDSKDYTTAIEKYSLIADKDMSDKINKAKAAYIKDHYDSSDEQTVSYLCDLRYENYGSAEEDYTKLIGWNVSSFVNSSETDYETQKNSIKAKDTIYVHTMFTNENNDTLNLYGYIVYSDGTRSNDVTFGTIENDYTTWISVEGANAIVGDAVMYIYTGDTGKLIEKYPFKIKKA